MKKVYLLEALVKSPGASAERIGIYATEEAAAYQKKGCQNRHRGSKWSYFIEEQPVLTLEDAKKDEARLGALP